MCNIDENRRILEIKISELIDQNYTAEKLNIAQDKAVKTCTNITLTMSYV